MSQLTLYNAPSPLPDRPQLRQERHFCRNQNQRSSSPVVGGLFTDPRSSSGPRKLALLTGMALSYEIVLATDCWRACYKSAHDKLKNG